MIDPDILKSPPIINGEPVGIDDELIRKLKKSRNTMTPYQVRERMVSGVFGLADSTSGITKDQIRDELNRRYGKIEPDT